MDRQLSSAPIPRRAHHNHHRLFPRILQWTGATRYLDRLLGSPPLPRPPLEIDNLRVDEGRLSTAINARGRLAFAHKRYLKALPVDALPISTYLFRLGSSSGLM